MSLPSWIPGGRGEACAGSARPLARGLRGAVLVCLALACCSAAYAQAAFSLAPGGGALLTGVDYTLTAGYRGAGIANTYLLLNTTLSSVRGASLWYDAVNNRIWLRNDVSSAWLGGHAPGSAFTIENSYVKVVCAQTTVSRSGEVLSVAWRVQLKDTMAGKTLRSWMYVDFSDQTHIGWNEMPPFTAILPGRAPVNVSITPSSGTIASGSKLTLQAAYSDPNGASDIASSFLLLNTVAESANVVYLWYDAFENKLFLRDDADASWLGGVAPGAAGTIENSWCALDASATTVSASGSSLVVNYRITLKPSLAGRTLKGSLFVSDAANQYDGWDELALLTPAVGNEKPVNVSVSPSAGTVQAGAATPFAAVYSDPNGYGNIAGCYLLLNSKIDGAGALYAWYDAVDNLLWLRNDANNAWLGGFAPGSSNTIENALAALDCAGTTVTGSGVDLTVSFRITPRPAAAGRSFKEFLYVTDRTGLNDGWDELGSVAVNAAPATGSLTPPAGALVTGTPYTFTATYSDANGASDISRAFLLLNTSLSAVNGADLYYDAASNKLFLRDDASSKWLGGFAPGSNNTIENSYIRVLCAQTVVTSSGANLSAAWRVELKDAMAGRTLRSWLWVDDRGGSEAGWTEKQSYSVSLANKPPRNVSISPSSGQVAVGSKVTLRTSFSDPNGAADVSSAYLLLNTTLEARNAVYLWYDAAGNRLFIRDDASTKWLGGVAPGTAGILENSQFKLNTGETAVTRTGADLIIDWVVEFKPAVANKPLKGWLYVSDAGKLSDGWDEMAALMPVIPNLKPVNVSLAPSSGTLPLGVASTISAVYSDPDGAAGIAGCYLLMNAKVDAAGAIYAWYDAVNNLLWLRNDANNAWQGGFAPGSANVIETSLAKVHCAATSVAASGANLTVSFSIEPKTAAGGRLLKQYLYVVDKGALTDGWDEFGAVTVASAGPVNQGLTPDGGEFPVNDTVTVTATYTHPEGASKIATAYLLLNTMLDGRNAMYVYWDRAGNRLYLRNDANTAWEGGLSPGAVSVIQNSQGWVDCENTKVTTSGNTLTIQWALLIKDKLPASGVRGWMFVKDTSGRQDGWDEMAAYGGSRTPANVNVTPASGTAYAGIRSTLIAQYTDPDGGGDLSRAYLLCNTALSSASACSLLYDASANRLYLRNDASTAWLGGYAPGSPDVIENSQCRVYCQETTAQTAGSGLTVAWRVEFKASMIGKALKTWLYCTDNSALSDGWDEMGTLSVAAPPNFAPQNVSLNHTGALTAGSRVTFTSVFSDANGAADIAGGYLLFNETANAGNACYLRYDAANNKLFIRDDANTAWLGGFAPASSNVIENANVKLYCADTTAAFSGSEMTVTWSVEFKSPMVGRSPKGWMYMLDRKNLSDGWDDMGTFPISAPVNHPPANVSLSPASGNPAIGAKQTFTAVYSDPNGHADINSVLLLINSAASGANGILCWYDRATDKLYLRDDADTAWLGGYAPGSANVIENSRATLHCAETTAVGDGQNLTVAWRVEPKSPMADRTAAGWLRVTDAGGLSDGYDAMGQYFFPGALNYAPACDSLTPASGVIVTDYSIKKSFTAVFSDINGVQDLSQCELLINSSLNMANGIYVRYDANANKLYLRNDANTAWLGGYAPGSANVISNSRAKLYCEFTSAAPSAEAPSTALEVVWMLDFLGLTDSNGVVTHWAWTQVSDDSSATQAWKQMGGYSILKVDLPPPPG